MHLEITYAVLLPFAATHLPSGQKLAPPKDLPPSYELDIEMHVHAVQSFALDGIPIENQLTIIDQTVMVMEYRYQLPPELNEQTIRTKNQLNQQLRQRLYREVEYQGDVSEEYVVLQIVTDQDLTALVNTHQFTLARFLRSIDTRITTAEAEEILSTSVRHGLNYLAVVDWEGAILLSDQAHFDSDVDLLMVGNYQLLRYRLLDRLIDQRLHEARRIITAGKRSFLPADRLWQDMINAELSLLMDYDKIDQSILLIGDWYSGKLYRTITEEFYIQDWRTVVKGKLETLARAEEIIRERVTVSWDRMLDLLQIFGWTVLLIGYFVLFFLELGR